jgi:uncharacterized membrane protein
MIDLILATKFVHVVAAAAMLGCWLTLAVFMQLAHASRNTSVVALVSRFAVNVEWIVMAGAIALQPISGLVLASAIGLSPLDEFWIAVSLVLYGVVVAAWLVALRIEIRIRDLTRQAVIDGAPLPGDYRRLYRFYRGITWPALAATIALFLLMVLQPRP